MNTVRLFVDGRGMTWALVSCPGCHAIRKYPAHEASVQPIRCACGTQLDVRDPVLIESLHLPRGPGAVDRGPAPDL